MEWKLRRDSASSTTAPQLAAVINKKSGQPVKLATVETSHGNALRVELSDSGAQKDIGRLTIAPGSDSLRILSINNDMRSQYRAVGSHLLDIARQKSREHGLKGEMSLICQDEGAAVFFYKAGFRFCGKDAEAKNAAIKAHIEHPDAPLPDDVLFLGDMSTVTT